MGGRLRATAVALALALVAGGLLAVPAALVDSTPAGAVVTAEDLTDGVTPNGLAQSLAGAGVEVSGVSYTGADVAAGRFGGGEGSIGFDAGVVLGTGRVRSAPDSGCEAAKGVEGPNECDGNTTEIGTDGDPALDDLAGFPTLDAAILEFSFVPEFDTVQFEYVFASEEYNTFANTQFNDVFAFFVNGENCATVPGSEPPLPVSVNTINGGNPLGTNPQNPAFYRDNDFPGGTIDVEADGLTTVLECTAEVDAGIPNTLRLAIADGTDRRLDSNVFLRAGSLVSGTAVAGTLSGGEATGTSIEVPPGTPVTMSAALSGANAAGAGGTVTYSVFDAACESAIASGGTKPVAAGVPGASDPLGFTDPGAYNWVVAYSGDALNNPSSTACGDNVQTVTGEPVSDLTITSEGQPDAVTAGASALRIVTVTNTGEGPAEDVSIAFTLPPGTTLVRTTPSQGTCGEVVGGIVTCELGGLAAGESADVRFVIGTPTVIPPGGTITSSASATSGGGGTAGPAESTTALLAPTPGTATGYVPPGGTLSTGAVATPGDNTVASFSLPDTGDGAVITITSEPCAPGVCYGKTMTFSPFEGYDDPENPAKFSITWDRTVRGTGLLSQAYVLKETDTEFRLVPPCQQLPEQVKVWDAKKKQWKWVVRKVLATILDWLVGGRTGIANPSPCVDRKTVLAQGGDVRFDLLFLSGDPGVRRR